MVAGGVSMMDFLLGLFFLVLLAMSLLVLFGPAMRERERDEKLKWAHERRTEKNDCPKNVFK